MMDSRPFDIFLSYPGGSFQDSKNVLGLGDALAGYGLRAWIAEREHFHLTDESKRAILKVLEQIPVFISCLGTREQREWGRTEALRAAARVGRDPNFRTCAVLLPGSDPKQLDSLPAVVRKRVFDLRGGLGDIGPLISFCRDLLRPGEGRLVADIVEACREGQSAVLITGPSGSGKSRFARRAAAALAEDFPAGQVVVRMSPGMSALEVLEEARTSILGKDASLRQYLSLLAQHPYLLVFERVELADASELVPPQPSLAIIVSRGTPTISAPHRIIEVPSRDSTEAGDQLREIQPGYTSDTTDGADVLDIQRPVQALCSVIAAKEVHPPLSIGLFGEWGAGKTFFIEQMRQRIDDLATASKKAEDSAYCSSIKQIVFNAWHYADANLWATLAERVFEGLADAGEGEAGRLYEELESSQTQLRQAKTDEKEARERAERAEEEEKAAQEEIEQTAIQLKDLGATAVTSLENLESTDPLLQELGTILHHGGPITPTAAEDLLTLKGALAQLWRQSRSLLGWLGLLLVAAVVLAVFLPNAIALVATLLPASLLALKLLAGPARWVLAARAEAERRAEALRRQENAQLESKLEQFREEEREARRRHELALRQVEEAQREIDEIKNGRKLFDFISERSEKSAYGEYHGLVGVVRRDFEVLSELIAQHTNEDGGLPQIERIVLYIDDLDRCPADRVLEVLEAVHLLMASELFVVLVAVDPRWLLSSLQRHYADEMPTDDKRLWAPTPEDYLEKIFQIPFSLPEMHDDGYRRLIRSLIPATEDGSAEDGEASATPSPGSEAPDEVQADPDGPPQLAFSAAQPEAAVETIELQPVGLSVTPPEIEFLSRLRSLVRTPRSAKRLANLYRLIRAALTDEELEALLGGRGEPPQYGCVQLLLAIVVGFPSLAPPLYARIAGRQDSGPWWDFVSSWEPKGQEDSWQRLVRAMEPLRDEPLPSLDRFAKWVPLVARYSYGALPVETETVPQ